MNGLIALKGNIIEAKKLGAFECRENGYIVTENGAIKGVFDELPEQYANAEVRDYGNALITQSFVDMHLHAPQYAMLGLGMDRELIDWLNTYTFKTEARYSDLEYARAQYKRLARELVANGTTTVCMFSSLHVDATLVLMEELEKAGITGFVGKVNMDRNSDDVLKETCEESLAGTERFIAECERFRHLKPILTPRFTPSCTDELMTGLGRLANERNLPVQSHLSENIDEIAWVGELHPDCRQYWETYEKYGLWKQGTVMAHCVHSNKRERDAMRNAGVYVAHCPDSNIALASGVAPIRKMLREKLNVTLGSDIAGGAKTSMLHSATEAIRASKLRYYFNDKAEDETYLTVAEAFYLATTAGHRYFGRGAGFAAGDMLHALVMTDERLSLPARKLTLEERLERIVYADDDRNIIARYSEGVLLDTDARLN